MPSIWIKVSHAAAEAVAALFVRERLRGEEWQGEAGGGREKMEGPGSW
jgi:hypothetical protein